jgi:hypothetical protein
MAEEMRPKQYLHIRSMRRIRAEVNYYDGAMSKLRFVACVDLFVQTGYL